MSFLNFWSFRSRRIEYLENLTTVAAVSYGRGEQLSSDIIDIPGTGHYQIKVPRAVSTVVVVVVGWGLRCCKVCLVKMEGGVCDRGRVGWSADARA